MPSMADITVKNAANADVVYVAKTPSAGDKSPAVWMLDGAHAIVGFRPRFEVTTRDNSAKNARQFSSTLSWPVIGQVNGVDTLLARVPIYIEATLPTNVDSAKVYDAYIQGSNLAVSALIRQVINGGFAPT